jgi:hypothetical protein
MVEDKFKIKKPNNWKDLEFHDKIKYFMSVITQDYSPYVDKLQAKILVHEMCKEINIAKVVRVLNGPEDIHDSDININYIIKSAHASRWNINITHKMSKNKIIHKLTKFNKQYNPTVELQYSYIQPRFFIEEKIDDKYLGKNGEAECYNFYCLNGKIQCIRIDSERCDALNMYDPNWKLIGENHMNIEYKKPKNYSNIVEYVNALCAPFEFVRIDLFIAKNDVVYFSEFTFTPNGGAPLTIPIKFVDEWV